jgi:hypothetical protein
VSPSFVGYFAVGFFVVGFFVGVSVAFVVGGVVVAGTTGATVTGGSVTGASVTTMGEDVVVSSVGAVVGSAMTFNDEKQTSPTRSASSLPPIIIDLVCRDD